MPESPDRPDSAPSRREARELDAAMRTLERLRRAQEPPPAPGAHAAPPDVRRPRPAVAVLAGVLLGLGVVAWLGTGSGSASALRYDRPPQFTPGEGDYAFLTTQPGTGEPVGFDPCRPVRYVVNPSGAPPDWRELIAEGVAHTEWATGLDLVPAGTTTAAAFNPGQYDPALGDMPVVIGFTDASQQPALEGDVVGIGGPLGPRPATSRWYYTSGSLAFDTDFFRGPSSGAERQRRQAVVDHELGHLVGLAHVDDPDQLMNAENVGQPHYGPGDLEGLARLGSIPCR